MSEDPGILSLGSHPNLWTLLHLYDRQPPDIIITDIPLIDGIPNCAEVRVAARCCPGTRVIVVPSTRDPEFIRTAVVAGASAYFLPDGTTAELLGRIREVTRGSLPRGVRVVRRCVEQMRKDRLLVDRVRDPLTARQCEVLHALSMSTSFLQAAEKLGLSVRGVRSHATRIYRRLGAGSLEEAVMAHANLRKRNQA